MVSNMPGSIAHDELPTVRNVFSEPYKKERHDSLSYGLTNDLPASTLVAIGIGEDGGR